MTALQHTAITEASTPTDTTERTIARSADKCKLAQAPVVVQVAGGHLCCYEYTQYLLLLSSMHGAGNAGLTW
jgi:hypothetical protein